MTKRLMPFVAMLRLLIMTGCDSTVQQVKFFEGETQVSVHVSGFNISQSPLPSTRAAQPVADYTTIGAVTLAFFDGENQVFQSTQIRSDATTYTTFGDFSCTLPFGRYTVIAIARGLFNGDEFTLTSPTQASYTSDRARETFVSSGTLDISGSDAIDYDITLQRVVAKLRVISTDGRPSGITKIRMTLAEGSRSFNPTTGYATSNIGCSVIVNPTSAEGAVTNTSAFIFLTSDEQIMNVTVQTLDQDDNVISSQTVADVPFKRNRETILTGPLYSATSTSTLQLDPSWLNPATVSF